MNSASKVLSNVQQSGGIVSHGEGLGYDSILDAVYDYIADNSDSKTMTTTAAGIKLRQERILTLIKEYVETTKPAVNKTKDMHYTLTELQIKLEEDITQYGPLTPAYVDPEVSEIQINDFQTIWVEKSGKLQIMTDEITGERVKFKNQQECFKIIQRLLRNSKAQFSKENTIAKGRTLEGYRIAAVHAEATAGEKGRYQSREPSPSCVIRKFPESNFTAKDLVGFKSMSCEMANALSLLPKVDITALVVGPTGSGKTVLVQLIMNNIPSDMRIYATENPSELGIKQYNEKGEPTNNVVQYESLADETEADKKNASRHTAIALMMQALRMTPHYFVFGEVRFNEEINQAVVAANTGHKFLTTTHAPDDAGAIRRFVNAVIACNPGIPVNTVIEDVCANVDFIICQEKKWDRSRKVMHITEVCGVEYRDGMAVPKLNRVFEFLPERKQPGDTAIRGSHWQVNDFSDAMKARMMSSIMDITEYDLLAKSLERDKDGKPIKRIGHYCPDLVLDMADKDRERAVRNMLVKSLKVIPESDWNDFFPDTFKDIIEHGVEYGDVGEGSQTKETRVARAVTILDEQADKKGEELDLDELEGMF